MRHAETRAGTGSGGTRKVLSGRHGAPAERDRADILADPVDGVRLGLGYTG